MGREGGPVPCAAAGLTRRDLGGPDILARVVRSRRLEVVEGWDSAVLTPRPDRTPDNYADSAAYFIPLLGEGKVVAVLATASTKAEKAAVVGRIEALQLVLDQMAIALGHAQLYEAVQHEVAERRLAEEALRVNQERLRVGLAGLKVTVFTQDLGLRYTWVRNPDTGLAGSAVIGKTDEELVPPEEAIPLTAMKCRVLATGTGEAAEMRYRVGGGLGFYHLAVEPWRDEDGTVAGIIGSWVDISERKRRERETRVSLSLERVRAEILQMEGVEDWQAVAGCLHGELRGLLQFNQGSVNVVDEEKGVYRSYGITADGLDDVGTVVAEIAPAIRQVMQSGIPLYRATRAELESHGDAVSSRTNSVVDVPFLGGTLAINSEEEDAFEEADIHLLSRFSQVASEGYRRLMDISDRTRASRALLQSSRLIALGEMAAGMAHELNQPLTVISALAEGVEVRLEAGVEMTPERVRTWGRQVLQGVDRMKSLVEHLRTFSRDRTAEPTGSVDLGEVANGGIALTKAQLRSRGIALSIELAEGLPRILGDQYRLEQVVLEVEDNGAGMDEAARLRCLEPFYTTKGPDCGTGLGLSISHAIVKDHGSEIECESTVGEGTVFRVKLPVAAGRGAETG